MAASLHGRRVELQVGTHDGGEQPGPDDVVRLGPQVHRPHPGEQVGVVLPPPGDLRGQRRRRPGVHDVRVGDEPSRLAPLGLGVAGGHVGGRVDRQVGLGRQQRMLVVGAPWRVQPVPHRERHAEEALPADEPVRVEPLDPAGVAGFHVGRVPAQLPAPLERAAGPVGEGPEEPLPAGHDLERPVALLVELDRVLDRPRLADAARPTRRQQLDHPRLGLADRAPGQLRLVDAPRPRRPARRGRRRAAGRRDRRWPAPAGPSSRHHTTSVVSPKVQTMAAPVPLSGWARGWARTGTSTPNSGVRTVRADQVRGEAGVVGVGDHRHAGRQQLRPGGVDQTRSASAGDPVEDQAVVGARALAVLQLGLGHRGLEVDVPEGRAPRPSRPRRRASMRRKPRCDARRAACVDGRVVLGPVDRQAQPPPHRLERLLVLGDQPLAQLHEVGARHGDRLLALAPGRRRPEARSPRSYGQGRVAAHPEVVLHPALGGQTVVVPAHRDRRPRSPCIRL